jgi:hypothetical protein
MAIDLVDDRQKLVRSLALAPVDLVHPDGLALVELSLFQPPTHKPFHRAVDGLPTGVKYLRRLPPRQSPPPPRQKK